MPRKCKSSEPMPCRCCRTPYRHKVRVGRLARRLFDWERLTRAERVQLADEIESAFLRPVLVVGAEGPVFDLGYAADLILKLRKRRRRHACKS